MDLRLRPLRLEDEAVARAADAELTADGFAFLLGAELLVVDGRRRYWID